MATVKQKGSEESTKEAEARVAVSTEVAVHNSQLPATIDFAADAGGGFEEADATSFAIPFLRQLQSISAQCKKSDPGYIKGAEEGDFFNTVSEKLYKAEKGLYVIPCHYIHKYNEWAAGRGGFRGSHSVAEYATLKKGTRIDDKGNNIEYNANNGNDIQDSREHYLLIIDDEAGTAEPVLMTFTSSQIKKSKKWMTQMQSIKIGGAIAPMFSQIYKISAIAESSDKYTWAGVKIEHIGPVASVDVYTQAKQFRDMVRSGAAKPVSPDNDDVAY